MAMFGNIGRFGRAKKEDSQPLNADQVKVLQDELDRRNNEIVALKTIVSNLRKEKAHIKMYYDPDKHSAPTIKVIEAFGMYVVLNAGIRTLYTQVQFNEVYGRYTRLHKIDNTKVLQ